MPERWEKFSKEELKHFVETSTSLNQVGLKCGYADKGSGNIPIRKMIEKYGFNISHFLDLNGSSHNKGEYDYNRFKKGIFMKGNQMKPAIVALRGYECECCHNKEWQNRPIPLEVHHIDGDKFNNQLDNLQLLCPNCHAQTENFRNKNQINKGISDEEFKQALESSSNIRQALIKLGIAPCGGNYKRANDIISKYNIHFIN